MRCLSFLIVVLATVSAVRHVAAADRPSDFDSHLAPFLKTYCVRCHSGDEAKAERRFDKLDGSIVDDNSLVDYQDILDLLNLGEMPPANEAQPAHEERRRAISWLRQKIDAYHAARQPARKETVLRRLNAREYRNTVRDLLQIELIMFDPTHGFPQDQTTHHLDNVGETLVTSGYLLQRYLDAADQVVAKAMTPVERPEPQTWTFDDNFKQQPEIDQVHRRTNKFQHMTLYEVRGADKHEGAYGLIHEFRAGVPVDGIYRIRFQADARHRVHQYDDDFLGTDKTEPQRLGIVPGDATVGDLHHSQPIEPLLTQIDLADGTHTYETEIWLDAGMTPRFTYENGPMGVRGLWTRVFRQYPDLLPKLNRRGIVEARQKAIEHGRFPQIRIDNIQITGPIYREWPTPGHRALLGAYWQAAAAGRLSQSDLRDQLQMFLRRAYRRSPTDDEVSRILRVIEMRHTDQRSLVEAYADGVKAAMCSPAFLYLDEQTGEDGMLDDTSLASRLSYFLWASLPDEELLTAAEAGRLRKRPQLRQQTERMLEDARAKDFVEGFLDSWLTLRNLGSTPPDRSSFPAFYHYGLGDAMRRETELFTQHLLTENLSVLNFLDSGFTFVNQALARHYDLPVPEGREFQKVALTDRRRGGLLGQASVLTVTANGVDTSPVVRGVWLLENILGTPPSPPPPDVEPLDPDIRGAKTIRDQLKKHRNVPSCNDCHRKIDPPGFALENFDPIGGWRSHYSRNVPVDASGTFPDGQSFEDVREFKTILLSREEQFVRALTEKLLTYASGRTLTAADRPELDRIVKALQTSGYGFRDLIHLVVASRTFQSP